jgi:hypothetical protein
MRFTIGGTGGSLALGAFVVACFWFAGFHKARRGKPRLFDPVISHVSERWVLFGVAVLGAVIMLAGMRYHGLVRIHRRQVLGVLDRAW